MPLPVQTFMLVQAYIYIYYFFPLSFLFICSIISALEWQQVTFAEDRSCRQMSRWQEAQWHSGIVWHVGVPTGGSSLCSVEFSWSSLQLILYSQSTEFNVSPAHTAFSWASLHLSALQHHLKCRKLSKLPLSAGSHWYAHAFIRLIFITQLPVILGKQFLGTADGRERALFL